MKIQLSSSKTRHRKPREGDVPPPDPPPQKGALETTWGLLRDTGLFLGREVAEAGKNDPALGMRLFATTVSDKLLEGVDDGVRESFDSAIVPTLRFGLLGLNSYRLSQTWKNPGASAAIKGLDVLRVATDLVGLAGGVMRVAVPAHAALGEKMVGFAYAADTLSHAIRMLEHGGDRLKVWSAEAKK